MHSGAVSMRVSFALRSAEAFWNAQCNASTIPIVLRIASLPFTEHSDNYRFLTQLLSFSSFYSNPVAVNSLGFPSGPPAQYWPGLASLSYGVRMGSGVFDAVWSTADNILSRIDVLSLSFPIVHFLLSGLILTWSKNGLCAKCRQSASTTPTHFAPM